MAESVVPSPGWAPGDTFSEVRVLCCPACGSLRVLYYGRPDAKRTAIYWRCGACKNRWKGTAKKVTRATVI